MTWPRPGERIDPDKEAAAAAWLKARYEKGAYIRELAKQTGRSYGFVHRLLREAGVPFRPRGSAGRRRPGSDGADKGTTS
ncbi:helix-turn-helix domain-containing protein [Streptomyces misionensis]